MEPKSNLKTVVITLFILTLLIQFSCSARSRKKASSPSPAPVIIISEEPLFIGRNEKRRRGSMPANCHGVCNQCIPCMPVEVSVRTMESEEDLYYPLLWKCTCHNHTFSP
ncbi:hypothetical protein Ddye_003459 [Dipteronia dyeriana]|uniref:Epidermal patterning factor-like protein n=1 Tax=Dipteronia dyeriana TaxID=168575 RepID=A0AAE0CVD3_9ROSI|nr:hypothetical protein Ddye_003459 [Dipteronia dyeriana]